MTAEQAGLWPNSAHRLAVGPPALGLQCAASLAACGYNRPCRPIESLFLLSPVRCLIVGQYADSLELSYSAVEINISSCKPTKNKTKKIIDPPPLKSLESLLTVSHVTGKILCEIESLPNYEILFEILSLQKISKIITYYQITIKVLLNISKLTPSKFIMNFYVLSILWRDISIPQFAAIGFKSLPGPVWVQLLISIIKGTYYVALVLSFSNRLTGLLQIPINK